MTRILAFLPTKRREARCRGNEYIDSKHKDEFSQKKSKAEKLEDFSVVDGKQKSKGCSQMMKLMAEQDAKTIENGKLLQASLDQGLGSFTPDLMMEKFVQDYKLASHIYGESIIRLLSGYESEYIERNIKIPEFQREMKQRVRDKISELKSQGLLDKGSNITDDGVKLASLVLYSEEIDNLIAKGIIGEKFNKQNYIYGDRNDVKLFSKQDSYKDIAIKKSIKTSIRRGHSRLEVKDLKSFEKTSKGKIYIVYALDSSGSMRGEKIATCKKAGVALAFKAIEERDSVGLIVFGKEVKQVVMPTDDFMLLLKEISTLKASSETNIASTIMKSIEMFPNTDVTKHLMLLTDAMPTAGKDPEKEALEAASLAALHGITISIVGIGLKKEAETFASKIVEIGKGKLHIAKEVNEIDKIVLEDYYGL